MRRPQNLLINVKTSGIFFSNFVSFLENLNFTEKIHRKETLWKNVLNISTFQTRLARFQFQLEMQFLLKDVCQVDHLHIHFRTGTTEELKIWWGRWGKATVITGK